MESGGSAVDGAIAADAVLGVALPDTCGPGGDLFAIVHGPADPAPVVLNASGRAGGNADAGRLRDLGHRSIPAKSHWSVTIPGCVDGWEALLGRFGRLPRSAVLAPAIGLAEHGFPVSTELAGSLVDIAELVRDQSSAAPLYPSGKPPDAGTVITRPRLAATLEDFVADGRDAFYRGAVGAGISNATRGLVTADDLAMTQADWIEPAWIDVFGLRAWTVPPNSQGYLTLAGSWIFEQLDPPRDPADPAYHHALVEAYRSVAWERGETATDPRSAPLGWEELLDTDRLGSVAGRIDPDRAGVWGSAQPAPGGTAYLATRDRDGMCVSFIQSNFGGIGSGLSAGDTGVWLHNRGAGFSLEPGHPNELTPGRRPLHTLSPTLWTRDGKAALLLGTRGGDQQPQLLMQVAANHLWAGFCEADSQSFPRWTLEEFSAGDPSHLLLESNASARVAAGLEARHHRVEMVAPWQSDFGPVSIVDIGTHVRAAADPRISTSAALVG